MEHAADAPQWLAALENSGVGQAMRQSLYLYPLVEVVHLVGIAALFGSILVLDLRLAGLARFLSAKLLAKHLLRLTWIGFALAVPSGALLFITEATSIARNPAFLVKASLIVLAGANMLLFHIGAWRSVDAWDRDRSPPVAARLAGAASVVLWILVIACGRLIAYF